MKTTVAGIGCTIGSAPIAGEVAVRAVPTLAKIRRLQAEMSRMPQAELPTEHFFADGMYARRLAIPAGALIVGKAHKREHLFMLMYGDLTVWTDTGMQRIGPGDTFTAKPGIKRVGLAHADSMCVTIHRTDSRDLDEIEAEIIEPEPQAMFDSHNHLKAIAP